MSFWKEPGNSEPVRDEFPPGVTLPPVDRRSFLQLTAAALGLVGLAACGQKRPAAKLVPYVRQPEALAEGESVPFATAHVVEGLATGLVVRSFEGRPVKAEGNPEHPASLGATSAADQAFLLELFSPVRAVSPKRSGAPSSWADFESWLEGLRGRLRESRGRGLAIVTETSTSPTLSRLMKELTRLYPGLRWVQYDPLRTGAAEEGCALAFGRRLDPVYDFARADLIVSFDADFLHSAPGALANARAFADRRRAPGRNFLFVAESSPSLTGANADARLSLPPLELEAFARAFLTGDGRDSLGEKPRKALDALEARLAAAGRAVFLAGEEQPPWLHALCQARNARSGLVRYIEPVRPPGGMPALELLARDLQAGTVDTLFLLGGNPAYASPAPLALKEAIARAKNRVRLSLEEDETAAACEWFLPMSHPLEGWGDALAFDGTVTFQQPLIDPLYPTRSPLELLALLAGERRGSEELVRATWEPRRGAAGWHDALSRGLLPGSARKPEAVAPRAFRPPPPRPAGAPGTLELSFRADFALHDGRYSSNAWLQELPRPLTELTWGNAVLLAPADARRLGFENGHVVRIEADGRALEAPARVQPGHAAGCATLTFGYGRSKGEGYDAYSIWTGKPIFAVFKPTGRREVLAVAQEHAFLGDRDPVRFVRDVKTTARETPKPVSLYPASPSPPSPYAWGMVIDLARCIGCKACETACVAENNIPAVGKEGVQRGRIMHWIRIDRYFRGPEDDPEIHFQPVPCMHCEKAPCEPVCPVAATTHNDEGLNQMIYNRCVGTRYCSNNCPYKVRRFNFFEYNKHSTEAERLLKNPDVSVRPRGVMEKCTYCVQRIARARIDAERENRLIRDGEVITACQAACPARAIEFGNLNDPASRVSAWRRHPGNYDLLGEEGTRPRTTYLAKEEA